MGLEIVLFKNLLSTILHQSICPMNKIGLAVLVLAPENYAASHPTKLHLALFHISVSVISLRQLFESPNYERPTLFQAPPCLGRLHRLPHVPCRCDASCWRWGAEERSRHMWCHPLEWGTGKRCTKVQWNRGEAPPKVRVWTGEGTGFILGLDGSSSESQGGLRVSYSQKCVGTGFKMRGLEWAGRGKQLEADRQCGGEVLHYWSSSHGWWCLQGHLDHRIVAFVARILTWQMYAPDSSSVCHLGHRQPGPSWCHSMGTVSIERLVLKSTLHINYIQGSICAAYLHSGMGITWDKISLALALPLTEVNSFVMLDPFLFFLFGNFTPAE